MPKNFAAWDVQIFHANDALAKRPPKQYAVRPILVLPSLNVIYGIAGSHKTNLVMDLATCVATNQVWLIGKPGDNFHGYNVTQSNIFWIDQDSGREALHERFGAMLRAHSGSDKSPIHYLSFPTPAFIACDNSACDEVVRRVLKMKANLVIFDNLGTISGGKDENSSEMIQVMNNLRRISTDAKVAVIVIHHDVKNDMGQRKTPRGHSSIEAAVDLALWVKRDEDVITVTPTKTRDMKFDAFSALFSYSHFPGTLELCEARFFGMEAPLDSTSQKAEDAICDWLVAHITANQSDLVAACIAKGVSRNRSVSEIQRLVNAGKIKQKQGLRKGYVYSF